MAEDIQKFDPATLMQGVKDRIKATFISLIPDEQWDQMVKKEIDAYFHSSPQGYRNDMTSNFSLTVRDVLQKEVYKRVESILNSPEFRLEWTGNKQTLPEFIRSELVAKAPEIFIASIDQMITNVILNMRNKNY